MSKLNDTTYNAVAANTVDDAVLDAAKILAWYLDLKTVVNGNDDELILKANKAQEALISATLGNGWTGTIQYAKNDLGIVTVVINATSGTIAADTIIATFPTGYRPAIIMVVPILNASTGNYSGQGLLLNTSGQLSIPTTGTTLETAKVYQAEVTFYAGN